jgi:hypothetical protein
MEGKPDDRRTSHEPRLLAPNWRLANIDWRIGNGGIRRTGFTNIGAVTTALNPV